MEKNKDPKEFYRLFWEFFKRGDLYPLLQQWREIFSQKGEACQKFDALPTSAMVTLGLFSGMANGKSFDDWWCESFLSKNRPAVLVGAEAIQEFKEAFVSPTRPSRISGIQSALMGPDPIETFCGMVPKVPERLLLNLDITSDSTIADQLDAIRIAIKKKKKALGLSRAGVFPTKQRPEYFQRLLDLYDAYQEKNPCKEMPEKSIDGTWKHIRANVAGCSDKATRTLQRDCSKAFQAVRNVEKGIFPGELKE